MAVWLLGISFILSFIYFGYLSFINLLLLEKYWEKVMFYALLHLTLVCDTHLLQVLCEYLDMHLITMSAYAFFCSLTMAGISVKHVESFQENC